MSPQGGSCYLLVNILELTVPDKFKFLGGKQYIVQNSVKVLYH